MELTDVYSGQEIALEGAGFGATPGSIVLRIGGMSLGTQVTRWEDAIATAQLPTLPVTEPVQAELVVMSPTGDVLNTLGVRYAASSPTAPDASAPATTPDSVVVNPGQAISIDGQIGAQQGTVLLVIGGMKLQANVENWTTEQTTAVLPSIQISEPVNGVIQILTADQTVADEIAVVVAPATGKTVASRQ
ncbi:hypothetical protein KOR42_10010 [Thalassoglobus neptunius]|uniref:IPT/TIG domain protein n=1 Tax=Thalassoglobus neptunius TaxID=1938619 RepID=A0A5C5X4X2_9PLAN|nr:hypothetical protein KOR42_10010 [Thalassoglobus neptunius]